MGELSKILEYKHEAVVNRFKREYPAKASNAEEVFEDLLRFFWGTKQHAQDRLHDPTNENLQFFFIMDTDMRDIDLMWHLFLLYTRDYQDFCQRYFGEYLHHQPDLVPMFEKQGYNFKENLEKFLNYTFDIFGESVVKRWFSATLADT
jgi:hypothetical protein